MPGGRLTVLYLCYCTECFEVRALEQPRELMMQSSTTSFLAREAALARGLAVKTSGFDKMSLSIHDSCQLLSSESLILCEDSHTFLRLKLRVAPGQVFRLRVQTWIVS